MERELLVENTDRGTVLRLRLRPGEVFSVVYQHSIYDQPVTEDFVLDEKGRIVLQAVTSRSAAVREYFGITSAGERHAIARTMPEIVFRIATGTAQRLRAGAWSAPSSSWVSTVTGSSCEPIRHDQLDLGRASPSAGRGRR
jgi:hypothetical protein